MLLFSRTDRDRPRESAPSPLRRRGGLIAALDVGTTKVACFIARAGEDGGALRVLGIGHHRSMGVRGGRVANLDEVEAAIRMAVESAEEMAGERIDGVVVAVSGGDPESQRIDVEMVVAGHEIRDADVRRILACGRQQPSDPDRELLHCIPVGYTIDGTDGVLDPRGMYGDRLGERELGATVIDMGGGTTSVGVFLGGHVIHVGVIPIGGGHVTNDIAQGLSTPLATAERLKTMYGSTLASPADAREILRVPLVGEDEDQPSLEIPRSYLVQIIRPRVEETLELVRAHLEAAGVDRVAGRRAVLTGGASQLPGVRELAEQVLDKQVRAGRPLRLRGLAESVAGPAFATCAGLLRHAVQDHVERPMLAEPPRPGGLFGPVERIGRWLRENF
jgi:cell division protein FtsA